MPYIGNEPAASFTSLAKQDITGNGGASYTLTYAVANANDIAVYVNNVRQEPSVAYTVSGTALTMTGNVASTDDFYVIYIGKALQTIVPPDGSVTSAKTNFMSSSSNAGLEIKGDGNTIDGYLQLNCRVNSHGIKLKSPPHSASQSYTLTFPSTAPSADKALITDGSGNLSFGNAGNLIQTRFNRNTTTVTASDTSTTHTAVSHTITPSSTSNKIIVTGQMQVLAYASQTVNFRIKLVRSVGGSDTDLQTFLIYNTHGSGTLYPYNYSEVTFPYIDEPNTTSEITYKVTFITFTRTGTVYESRTNAYGGGSVMCLQEVSV